MEQKPSLLKTFLNPLLKENAIFVMLLGLCPVLIVTDTFDKSFGMGMAVILVLIFTNLFISLIRKIVPSEVRIPVFIVIIACFVSIVERLMQAYTPSLYDSLGVIISMITVNCIVLGRGEAFAYKNGVGASVVDALGTGCGFCIAVSLLGIIREFFGKGGLTFTNPFTGKVIFSFNLLVGEGYNYTISALSSKMGAFLILGLAVGIFSLIKITRDEKKALEAKAKEAK